jgi:hypothetical protein
VHVPENIAQNNMRVTILFAGVMLGAGFLPGCGSSNLRLKAADVPRPNLACGRVVLETYPSLPSTSLPPTSFPAAAAPIPTTLDSALPTPQPAQSRVPLPSFALRQVQTGAADDTEPPGTFRVASRGGIGYTLSTNEDGSVSIWTRRTDLWIELLRRPSPDFFEFAKFNIAINGTRIGAVWGQAFPSGGSQGFGAFSNDGGETWTPTRDLPGYARLLIGSTRMVLGPLHGGSAQNGLFMSADNGEHWKRVEHDYGDSLSTLNEADETSAGDLVSYANQFEMYTYDMAADTWSSVCLASAIKSVTAPTPSDTNLDTVTPSRSTSLPPN